MPVSQECLETRTKESTRLDRRRAVDRLSRHRRQHGWTCPQLPFLLQCGSADQAVHDVFSGFVRMLGHVLVKQLAVVLRVSAL